MNFSKCLEEVHAREECVKVLWSLQPWKILLKWLTDWRDRMWLHFKTSKIYLNYLRRDTKTTIFWSIWINRRQMVFQWDHSKIWSRSWVNSIMQKLLKRLIFECIIKISKTLIKYQSHLRCNFKSKTYWWNFDFLTDVSKMGWEDMKCVYSIFLDEFDFFADFAEAPQAQQGESFKN
jgi:hypothetical protein